MTPAVYKRARSIKKRPGQSDGGGFTAPLVHQRLTVPLWEAARFVGEAWMVLADFAQREDERYEH